jgi:hypothetical protein
MEPSVDPPTVTTQPFAVEQLASCPVKRGESLRELERALEMPLGISVVHQRGTVGGA